ncbi:MAG: nucleotidyltransferase domain-containing protein [Thermoplasmata archaeon]
MTKRLVRLGHCYRCVYTWRMRRRRPSMCPRCKSRLWDVPVARPVRLGTGLGIDEVLGPHRAAVLRIARRYGVSKVEVFGSVRRREATEKSDVDLMLTWRRPHSLLDRAGLGNDLEALLGRPVDLVYRGGLHWSVKPQVEAEVVPL